MRCSSCNKQTLEHQGTMSGHSGGTATCTGRAKCSICGDPYGDFDAHDTVSREGKAATCTKSGYEKYETCTRCDWTTYKEISALNHNYQRKKVVKPTCENDGYTLYACTRCGDSYTRKPVEKLLHWYGEWTSDGSGVHSALCRRDGCGHSGKTDC